ncbi:hypothetical protein [Pandoraea sp. SD6-2]|uniref:hypothetical protein n=1 Tax=Pandoraea sp. SD6-2 TaxID=1286093 RepID=UPI0011857111|nr:hypothetical protein [Pandoraea sp. SD6-2]
MGELTYSQLLVDSCGYPNSMAHCRNKGLRDFLESLEEKSLEVIHRKANSRELFGGLGARMWIRCFDGGAEGLWALFFILRFVVSRETVWFVEQP